MSCRNQNVIPECFFRESHEVKDSRLKRAGMTEDFIENINMLTERKIGISIWVK